jgi:ABC-type antimicrobial peptide transport system permease subunit
VPMQRPQARQDRPRWPRRRRASSCRTSLRRTRPACVAQAIGLTLRQIVSTVVSAHAALALLASLLAVPLGIGLYLALFHIAGDASEDAVIAPWWSLALVPVGTVLVVVAATSLPARLATRIHTADALRHE